MNKDLEKDLSESIKKNLPSQVSDVLKEKLNQADIDAALVISLKIHLEETQKSENELIQKLDEYKKLDDRNSKLDIREKELDYCERKQEIDKLTYQLSSEKDKTEFAKSIGLGLVRNIEYRKTIFDDERGSTGNLDQWGNPIYSNVTKSYAEHTKTE